MRSSPLRIDFRTVLIGAGVLVVFAGAVPAPREIDVAKSTARFSVSHIWVEHVTGTVPIVAGAVTLAGDSLVPESASAVLDATRIASGEPDRDASLESPDFFDAAKYPHWTFTSTKVEATSANTFTMDGGLTVHGVTQPVELAVTANGSPAHPQYHAVGKVDRHAFGMARTRLDPTIGESVDVTLDIVVK